MTMGMHKTARPGQGMLEMLIAIALLVGGLVAVLTLTVRLLHSSADAGARTTATALATELIEVVHAVRDANWMQGNPAFQGMRLASDRTFIVSRSATGWALDFSPNTMADAATRVWQGQNGFFVQAPGVPSGSQASPYRRLGTLRPWCAPADASTAPTLAAGVDCPAGTVEAGMRVTSRVEWSVSGRAQQFELSADVYDWR